LPGIVSGETDLSFLPRYLLLWQAWSIEYRGTTWLGMILLPPAWSISVEVFFYMLYPLLAGALLRLRAMSKLLAVLALIVFGYYLAVVLGYIYFDELRVWGNEAFHINADPKNALLGWIFNTGPVGRVWEFLMGALVAQAYLNLRSRPPSRHENRVGTYVLYASIILTAVIYLEGLHSSFFAYFGSYPGGLSALFAVMMFCCARYKNRVVGALGSRVAVKLGDASYSIYLIHLFTLQLFTLNAVFPPTTTNLFVWVLMMVSAVLFTLIIALGTYHVVEAPSRVFLRRVLHRFKNATGAFEIPEKRPLGAASSAILLIGVLTCFALWNRPRPTLIDIVDATYGENCKSFVPAPPTINQFRPGNATDAVRQTCAGSNPCNFAINVNRLGEPAGGCAKDFSVTYRCSAQVDVQIVRVAPEAHGKTAVLACP